MTVMYDGIAADAAAIHAHAPGAPVACYINGLYTWSPAQESMFGRKIRISVMAGQPNAAKYARVLDVESGDATPADVPAFMAARDAISSNGTVYCSLLTVPDVLSALGARRPRWWLAWYWNRPGAPDAAQVNDELHAMTGHTLPVEDIWACQYASHLQWDQSIVYGAQDWSR